MVVVVLVEVVDDFFQAAQEGFELGSAGFVGAEEIAPVFIGLARFDRGFVGVGGGLGRRVRGHVGVDIVVVVVVVRWRKNAVMMRVFVASSLLSVFLPSSLPSTAQLQVVSLEDAGPQFPQHALGEKVKYRKPDRGMLHSSCSRRCPSVERFNES